MLNRGPRGSALPQKTVSAGGTPALPASQHLQFLPVKGDDLVGVVGEEDVVGDPGGGAAGADHLAELAAQVGPKPGVEKYVGDPRADAELEVAQLDADLLQR